jgi:uncharacterized protein YggE
MTLTPEPSEDSRPARFPITRRTAVLGAATLLALGGAVVVGLSGNSAAPPAGAATHTLNSYPIGDSTAISADAFPGITVQGVGKVTGTPDTLILSLSITKNAADVSTAMGQVSTTMKSVQDAFTAAKIAQADLKTSGLNVGPRYDYTNGKQTLSGYTASESLIVTLRDTKTAGATITAAVGVGGDSVQVSSLSTDLQDNAALLNAARESAMADAKAKAAQYAKSAGRGLGPVVRVQEAISGNSPQPMYNYPQAAGALADKASVPIQVGSTDLSVQVTVVFSFV